MKKYLIGVGIVILILGYFFLYSEKKEIHDPIVNKKIETELTAGGICTGTIDTTPKFLVFNEKTEEEMKGNLVNILKYRTCSEKDNFDKTVTMLCSEIIDPTTKIIKENNTYKLEAPHEVYYTPKEMHTISYWINEITPDGAFTITGDYHHYTVSTKEEYEERRKINFENLFSVLHYERENEQDYEYIKATLQTPEFQGRNFAIPGGLNDTQYEQLKGSLDEYLLNHQGTCERENLSFLSNLNENNRNTLLSSLSHFCKGEKEIKNLNTLKKIFTFPKEKWKILIEMIQFDQEYHGYDSKKEYNKEILEKYYTLADTERMKILPYFNPELPTFLKEFKFLDRLLQTIDFEDGEIEDLKYLLKTDIFTLQKNKITKIPDYTKAIGYNNSISKDHFKEEVYYKNHWYVERGVRGSFFSYNDKYGIFLQFDFDGPSMAAPEPEFILHSYFYDHQYIKFSRAFYLIEAYHRDANRNSPLENFGYDTYFNPNWIATYEQTLYKKYSFDVPKYLIIMGKRYDLEQPVEGIDFFGDECHYCSTREMCPQCAFENTWKIGINHKNVFLGDFDNRYHAENKINATIQKRGYIDGEYAVSFEKYPNIIFKYTNEEMKNDAEIREPEKSSIAPWGVTFIEDEKMINNQTLVNIEKTKQILCEYGFKGTSLICGERGLKYDSIFEKTLISIGGRGYKESGCERYEICTFDCPYITRENAYEDNQCGQCSINTPSYKSCYYPTSDIPLFKVEKTSLDHWYFFYPTTGVKMKKVMKN